MVKPGRINKKGNPKPHTLDVGTAMWIKNTNVSRISSAKVTEYIRNQKLRNVAGGTPCALNVKIQRLYQTDLNLVQALAHLRLSF